MDLSKIKGYEAKPAKKLKEFAVNLALIKKEGAYHIVFERRALTLPTQPGEICLAGGKLEAGESFLEAAIRETVEELGVREEQVKYIADLDYILDFPLRVVKPFLTFLEVNDIEELNYQEAEVSELFTVPLDFFRLNPPELYKVITATQPAEDFPFELIPGGRDYNWGYTERLVPFYLYKDKIIWGLTANVIRHSIEIFEELGVFN